MIIHLHTILVLCHLLALALGLGSALLADWIVLRKLAFATITPRAAGQLIDLSHAVCAGLALIWVTGAFLVMQNAMDAPLSIMNQKLWAKLAIVVVLTFNALLLHRIALPMVASRIGQPLFETIFDRLPMISSLFGVVSGVSWTFAAYLGVARELNGLGNLIPILSSYLLALLLVWAATIILSYTVQHHRLRFRFHKQATTLAI